MKQHIRPFLEYKKGIENRSDFTIKSYRHDLELLFRFADGRPISKTLIIKWLGQWDKAATKNRRLAVLKAFFNYLEDGDIIDKKGNFPQKMITPRVDSYSPIDHSHLLTKKELADLLAACKTSREKSVVLLLLTSGVRARELLSIEVENLNLKTCRGFLKQRKRHEKGGPFKFSKYASMEVKKYLAENKIKKGKIFPFQYEVLRLLIKKLGRKAGIPRDKIHLHLFRHMWATEGMRKGINILLQLKFGGWSDPRTLKRYSHISPEEEDKEYERAFG